MEGRFKLRYLPSKIGNYSCRYTPFVHTDSTVNAHYKNGILELDICKKDSSVQKRIEIKS